MSRFMTPAELVEIEWLRDRARDAHEAWHERFSDPMTPPEEVEAAAEDATRANTALVNRVLADLDALLIMAHAASCRPRPDDPPPRIGFVLSILAVLLCWAALLAWIV